MATRFYQIHCLGNRPWAFTYGPLESMPRVNLGRAPTGAVRRYRVTVAFPEGGTPPTSTGGDNAYQGTFAGVDSVWTAQEL